MKMVKGKATERKSLRDPYATTSGGQTDQHDFHIRHSLFFFMFEESLMCTTNVGLFLLSKEAVRTASTGDIVITSLLLKRIVNTRY
jgi:hypothetical protein